MFRRLALALPDIPRWVWARSLLLEEEGEVIGLVERGGLDFVLRDPEARELTVVGWPAPEAIIEAVRRNGNRGDLLVQLDNQGPVVAALPGWRKSSAILHLLGDASRLSDGSQGDVRLLTAGELTSLAGLPTELKAELEDAFRWSPMAATYVEGAPVSFCYASAVTESLWDISIDTLEAHRRRGFASLCVSYMVRRMRKMGKQPVWAALESNAASLALAAKLGFEAVDRVVMFEPPNEG